MGYYRVKTNDVLVQFRAPSSLNQRIRQASELLKLPASELWRQGAELLLKSLEPATNEDNQN